jgi:GNAT superfamily N-acetyltransferase
LIVNHHHPRHDAIAATVRAWYTTSAPSMGYHVERRRFGFYMRHPVGFGEVTVAEAGPEDVPALLADVRATYGDTSVGIYIDDRRVDADLGPVLAAAGCTRAAAETHLAHVGAAPEVRPVPGVLLEPMTEATVAEWSATKLKGFAGSEQPPGPEHLAAEVAVRRAEVAGEGRFFFARAGREPASIIGLYDGEDRHIFLLATRVPFRNRGIARWLLSHAIAAAHTDGCRSVLINCDPADTPIRLYRRLGFTDEVYWRQRYELPPPAPAPPPQPGP